jgi:hypothetical protein
MSYGTIKVDTITFTDNSVDKSVSLSGLIQNPTFTGNITVTGTISGDVIRGGTTVSGATVTGTTANFVSGVFTTQISGATVTGTTVLATTGAFTSLTGTTTQGTTATYTTGSFTSLTGTNSRLTYTTGSFTTGSFTSLTGTTIQGTTATYTTGSFTSLTGTTVTGTTASFTSGVFTNISGTTATITSGIIASGTAAAPSLAILADLDTGLFSPGANELAVATNGTARLYIASDGKVGVGTTTPGANLQIGDGSSATLGSTAPYAWVSARALSSAGAATTPQELLRLSWQEGDQNLGEGEGCAINFAASLLADSGTFYPVASIASFKETDDDSLRTSALTFSTSADGSASPTERLRIDSSGRLLVGTSSSVSQNIATGTITPQLQNASTNQSGSTISSVNYNSDGNPATLALGSSTGGTVATQGVVNDNGKLGRIAFTGSDGTTLLTAAEIIAEVDGTPDDDIMPGRLVFRTTAAGDSSPTERMSITSAGNIATSGDLEITSTTPTVRLLDTDSAITHRQTSLQRSNEQFRIVTRSNTDAVVSSDYILSTSATGATEHAWHIVDIEKATLNSNGLQVVDNLYISDKIVHTGDTNTAIRFPAVDTVTIETSGTEQLRISSDGRLVMGGITAATGTDHSICTPGRLQSDGTYSTTTASSANVVILSSGLFLRSTSSIKYKTEVEDAELSYSEALVYGSRPVWYRSLSESDPSDYSYWGFIAEEVAEIDPRMVHWGDDGPEGVQYDRYVVHLVGVIQKQQQRLDALEARIAALEAEVAALKAQ